MAPSPIDPGQLAQQLAATVIAHRRALHRIPELSDQERDTAAYLVRELQALGLQPQTGLAGSFGLSVTMPGGASGPTVLIRADMDALPIEQDPAETLRSERPGVMHACGHDGHMAIALGVCEAAQRLAAQRALPGRLVVVFQPAEESGGGAARLVADGLLERHAIDVVLGLHLWSFLPRGQAVIPDGTVMASADEFRIELRGRGGHGALPHLAQDVVVGLSQLVSALQTAVSRAVDPLRPAVVTVGRIEAGSAPNVLPECASLWGTFRAPDETTRLRMQARIEALTAGIAQAHELTPSIVFDGHYPPTVNDPRVAALMRDAAREVLTSSAVLDGPPTMAAEDFGVFLQQRPGAFMLLGMRDEEAGVIHPHHTSRFRIAEPVLAQGVEILLRASLAAMGSAADLSQC